MNTKKLETVVRTATAVLIFVLSSVRAAEFSSPALMEAYPEELQARIEARDRFLLAATTGESDIIGIQYVIIKTSRWAPNEVMRVAFNGGDSTLHKDVATVAQEWCTYANVKFDFGQVSPTGSFRTWSTNDSAYVADIRVSFDRAGYWSVLGRDSINPDISHPGEPSLNLAGFTRYKPWNWKGIVLHEFGHALGFHHEHQHPTGGCDRQFRWQDDSGYEPTTNQLGEFIPDINQRRPGIYTVLGGPPNRWSKPKIDFNLRQLPDSRAFLAGSFDTNSIMKYSFDEWMFLDGKRSFCFSQINTQLSDLDKKGAARAYPRSSAEISRILDERKKLAEPIARARTLPIATQKIFEGLTK